MTECVVVKKTDTKLCILRTRNTRSGQVVWREGEMAATVGHVDGGGLILLLLLFGYDYSHVLVGLARGSLAKVFHELDA